MRLIYLYLALPGSKRVSPCAFLTPTSLVQSEVLWRTSDLQKVGFPPVLYFTVQKKNPPLFAQITRLQMSNSWRCTPVVTRRSLLSTCRAVSGYAGNCFYLHQYEKYGLSCTEFDETLKCWTALRADISYRISPKSDNNCEKYEWTFI